MGPHQIIKKSIKNAKTEQAMVAVKLSPFTAVLS